MKFFFFLNIGSGGIYLEDLYYIYEQKDLSVLKSLPSRNFVGAW